MASSETPLEHSPAYLRAYIGYRAVNVAIVFIVLEVVVVAARFYARTKVSASLATDDFLTIPALVRSMGDLDRLCLTFAGMWVGPLHNCHHM